MNDSLDLSILDGGSEQFAVLYARCGGDMALGRLPFGAELTDLASFRDRIEQAARGVESRPKPADLADYGHRLFSFTFRDDDVKKVYNLLPQGNVSIHIMSNQAELQKLPWEFLQEPGQSRGPRRSRSVVRIVPTVGKPPPPPPRLGATVRVLFVSAAPADQEPVDFQVVKGAIERAFRAKWRPEWSERFTIEAVDGATRDSLRSALARRDYDILHFSGHGDVDAQGRGRLLLVHRKTGKTDFLDSESVCKLLCERDLRLVILSACDTAKGDFRDDFAVVAQALVRGGMPAVIANQMPVKNKSIAPFVGAVYESLLVDGDIDLAVAEGRIALDLEAAAQDPDTAAIEWGIPTLYRHYRAAQLFTP